jgi:hypothetical protein
MTRIVTALSMPPSHMVARAKPSVPMFCLRQRDEDAFGNKRIPTPSKADDNGTVPSPDGSRVASPRWDHEHVSSSSTHSSSASSQAWSSSCATTGTPGDAAATDDDDNDGDGPGLDDTQSPPLSSMKPRTLCSSHPANDVGDDGSDMYRMLSRWVDASVV